MATTLYMDKDMTEFLGFLMARMKEPTAKIYLSQIRQLEVDIAVLRGMCDDDLLKLLMDKISENRRVYYRRSAYVWLLRYLKKEDILIKLPRTYQLTRLESKKSMTFNQIQNLANSAGEPQLSLLVRMFYDTACRKSAILDLKRGNIDFTDKLANISVVETKTEETKTLYLSEPTTKALREFVDSRGLKPEDKIFSYRADNCWKDIKELATRVLGMSKVSPHWFRHSRAIHLLQGGESVVTVSDLLGHRSMESTRRYIKESGIESKKLMETKPPKWN